MLWNFNLGEIHEWFGKYLRLGIHIHLASMSNLDKLQ